jgi:hypothetical protein
MDILLSFAPQGCGRERGVGAAYRLIRMRGVSGYMAAHDFLAASWNAFVAVSILFDVILRQKPVRLLLVTSRV